jgi:hypothetical protein
MFCSTICFLFREGNKECAKRILNTGPWKAMLYKNEYFVYKQYIDILYYKINVPLSWEIVYIVCGKQMVQWKLSNLALPCQEKNIGSKKWYLFKNKLLDRNSAHSTLRMSCACVCMCVYCVKTLLRLLNGKVHLSRICLICYRNIYCFVAYCPTGTLHLLQRRAAWFLWILLYYLSTVQDNYSTLPRKENNNICSKKTM